MTYEQEQRFTRLSNDVNGNPRYYIGVYELADLVGATVAAVAIKAGFRKYRGKKYGAGYVVVSYNLEQSLSYLKAHFVSLFLTKTTRSRLMFTTLKRLVDGRRIKILVHCVRPQKYPYSVRIWCYAVKKLSLNTKNNGIT